MSLGKIFINGIYTNLKRLIFASDRVTDMQFRNDVLTGNVKPAPLVAEVECIGCGGCSNVCPTKAIVMTPIEPVEIAEGIVKTFAMVALVVGIIAFVIALIVAFTVEEWSLIGTGLGLFVAGLFAYAFTKVFVNISYKLDKIANLLTKSEK
jgi:ferredoxin